MGHYQHKVNAVEATQLVADIVAADFDPVKNPGSKIATAGMWLVVDQLNNTQQFMPDLIFQQMYQPAAGGP